MGPTGEPAPAGTGATAEQGQVSEQEYVLARQRLRWGFGWAYFTAAANGIAALLILSQVFDAQSHGEDGATVGALYVAMAIPAVFAGTMFLVAYYLAQRSRTAGLIGMAIGITSLIINAFTGLASQEYLGLIGSAIFVYLLRRANNALPLVIAFERRIPLEVAQTGPQGGTLFGIREGNGGDEG